MGKSQRFKQLVNEVTPGPNQYKLPGFADEIMKKTFNRTHVNKTPGEDTKNNFFNKTSNTSNAEKQSSIVSGKNEEMYNDIKENEHTISKYSDNAKPKKLQSGYSNIYNSNKDVRVVSKHNSENSLEININNNEVGIASEYFDNKNATKSNFFKPSSKNTIQSNKEHEDIYMDVSSNKDSINC